MIHLMLGVSLITWPTVLVLSLLEEDRNSKWWEHIALATFVTVMVDMTVAGFRLLFMT